MLSKWRLECEDFGSKHRYKEKKYVEIKSNSPPHNFVNEQYSKLVVTSNTALSVICVAKRLL